MRMDPMLISCGIALALGLVACRETAEPAATDDVVATRPATESRDPPPAARLAAMHLTVVRSDDAGAYVADSAGSALYALEGDVAGEGCVETCPETWPPVLIEQAQPTVAAGLQPNLVSVVERPDGTRQVTYGNRPLYRYAGDAGAGRTAGHGVSDRWGRWHLVGVGGEPLGKAPAKPT